MSLLRRIFGGARRAADAFAAAAPAPEAAASRRELLRGAFLRRAVPAASTVPLGRVERLLEVPERIAAARTIPLLRPPGAVREEDFLAGCTRCMDCAKACPHQAITTAGPRLRAAAGTPVLQPGESPCLMCADTPCISACVPRVLRQDLPRRMGLARISVLDCLAHQGSTCSSCAERCPVPGAIVLDGGRPRVVESACTGCGVCHHVCPAPRNAVAITPTLHRPAA